MVKDMWEEIGPEESEEEISPLDSLGEVLAIAQEKEPVPQEGN